MQLQLIFDEIAEKKQRSKELLANYKNALKNNEQYQTLLGDMGELKERKKAIEESVLEDLGKGAEELEEVKASIKGSQEMMTDVALNNLVSGKTVAVKDEFGNEYEPIWSVKFKKIK